MLQFEVLDWAPPSICLLTGILGNGNVPGMKSIKMFIRSHGLNVLIFAAALSVLGLGYAAFSSFGDYGEVTSVQSFGRK